MGKKMTYAQACDIANKVSHQTKNIAIKEFAKLTGRNVHVTVIILAEPDPGGASRIHVATSMIASELSGIMREYMDRKAAGA